MSKIYFTVTGLNHYYGSDFFRRKMIVKLKKEPDNEYDHEAITIKVKGIGKVGYVANSSYTVLGESMSAGRLYDKIGKKAHGRVEFILPQGVICSLISEEESKAQKGASDEPTGESDSATEIRIDS